MHHSLPQRINLGNLLCKHWHLVAFLMRFAHAGVSVCQGFVQNAQEGEASARARTHTHTHTRALAQPTSPRPTLRQHLHAGKRARRVGRHFALGDILQSQ